MHLIFFLLLSLSAFAGLRVENNEIQPFSYTNYPLKSFVKDYAEMMDLNVTYVAGVLRDKDTVNLKLNAKVKKEEFKNIFYNVIDNFGVTGIEDHGVLWLNEARDIRFLISHVYIDESYPKNASFSTVIHKLKYPVSSEIARNLRPFMSRYGRVIDFFDGRTILLHDKGDNVSRLLETVKYMDTEKAYQSVLNYIPKPDPDADNPLKEKILDLETEKKILEKKYMELKEEHQS